MFSPSRLTLARERRGMTKKRLAEKIGVSIRALTKYEVGDFEPSAEHVDALARELSFARSFFFAEEIDMPDASGVSFRSMAAMTSAQRSAAIGAATLAVALDDWISARFVRPDCDLPSFRDLDPEAAASMLRTTWGLGEQPIKNVVRQLEAHGVRVYSLAEQCREMDAFSFWRGDVPFVFLNTQKSAEHSRFDASHELAHLVLHRHGGPQGGPLEQQANAFAAAFLMPRGGLLAKAPRIPDVNTLISLKSYWGVSVAALNYRLHTCRLISDWHYRNVCVKIAKLGYRMSEPEPSARETSGMLQRVFQELRDNDVSKEDVARDLHISTTELEDFVFGLVMQRVAGEPDDSVPTPPARTAHKLRRV